MRPLVSILIPCYKQAEFLPDALDSVLAQTYPEWECIIINDGSPDNTEEVALGYVARDPRIRLINQANQGLCRVRDRGIAESRGRYIQLLDADDFLAPEKIERQVQAVENEPALTVAFSDFRYCDWQDTTKTIYMQDFHRPRFRLKRPIHDLAARWETDLSIPCHSFLFDARIFKEHDVRHDPNLANHSDWDCWMHVLRLDPKLVHVPGELVSYRLSPGSMSRDLPKMRTAFDTTIKKHMEIERQQSCPDPELIALLDQKRRQMWRLYSNEIRRRANNQRRLAILKAYHRHTPWPIQRVVHKFFGI